MTSPPARHTLVLQVRNTRRQTGETPISHRVAGQLGGENQDAFAQTAAPSKSTSRLLFPPANR